MHQHLLITGRPGVGKTTLIKKIVAEIRKTNGNWVISGFYTNEIRQNGLRIGFNIHTFDGQEGILARSNDPQFKSKFRVGKYSVDVSDLDNIAVPLLYKFADLLIIDELGKMELYSSKFRNAVTYALNTQLRIVATLPSYENPFLASIKSRPNIQMWELTRSNRVQLFIEVIQAILNTPGP